MTELLDCTECIETLIFTPEELGSLRTRDFDLRMIRELNFDEIESHNIQGPLEMGDPNQQLAKVFSSVSAYGVIRPILVVAINFEHSRRFDLVDGNQRAWSSYDQRLDAPVLVFTPTCGNCTEASFLEQAIAHTIELDG